MNKNEVLHLLTNFKKSHQEKYKIMKLGIFGSVAKGIENSESDVDIVIKTNSANLFLMVHFKEELENLFHNKVDIVRYREKMNPYLKRRIDADAIYV